MRTTMSAFRADNGTVVVILLDDQPRRYAGNIARGYCEPGQRAEHLSADTFHGGVLHTYKIAGR